MTASWRDPCDWVEVLSSRNTRIIRYIGFASLAFLLVVGWLTPPDAAYIPRQAVSGGPNDADLYNAVIDRIGQGDGYYEAMGAELEGRGYPTGSVVNWRTPLYLTLLARAPWLILGSLWLLGALVVAGTAFVAHRLTTPSRWAPVVVLQIGVVMTVVNPLRFTYSEPLAGLLIALSVLVALRGWHVTSVLLGSAALFVRELAAPYVGIRFMLALWKRDWRDAAGWGLGLTCYTAYYLWHWIQVIHAMPLHATVHVSAYWQFGGLQFFMATLNTNVWLALLPWWVMPVALVAAIWGACRAPLLVRFPVLGYLALFAVVGMPFNWYWGWVPGMLLPLAWAHAAAALPSLTIGRRSMRVALN